MIVSCVRAVISAAVLICVIPTTGMQSAKGQELERYSAEGLWLSQTITAMQNFIGMLEPIYETTTAMTREYPDVQAFESEANIALESARIRLAMIHDNAVWLISMLPERPVTTNRSATQLMNKIGDPIVRAENIRIMSDAVLANFEGAIRGDETALDQGILEAVRIFDELIQITELMYEVEAVHLKVAHPVTIHAMKADNATLQVLVRARQMWFLAGLSDKHDEYDRVLASLITALKSARTESGNVVRAAEKHRSGAQLRNEYLASRDADLIKEYLETEEARTNFMIEVESLLFQLTRTDTNITELERSFSSTFGLVPFLDPAHRELMRRKGKSVFFPEGHRDSVADANL